MTEGAATPVKHICSEVDIRSGGEDLPLLSVSIYRGVVPRTDLTDRETRADDTSGYKRCQRGDLVLNRMSAFQGAVGISRTDGIVTPEYLVLRARRGVEPRFLHYVFKSSWFVGQMTWRLRGIGSPDQSHVRTPRIYWGDLGSIRVSLPSVPSQLAVADYLDAETARIDALVEKKRRMIGVLDEQWQAVMRNGVTGLLTSRAPTRPTAIRWLREVPIHWQEAKLNLIARLGSGHTPSRQHPEWWTEPTIPWITTGEVTQMRTDRIEYIEHTREMISELGLSNSAAELHPADTVVLCRTASAGYSAIMARDMATSQDFATWTCGPLLRPRFLLLCLRVMRQDLLGRLAMGSTHKTIYMPDIESIKVPLPTASEQDAIVDAVYSQLPSNNAAVDGLRRQIRLLLERREALITSVVTGELDISGGAG